MFQHLYRHCDQQAAGANASVDGVSDADGAGGSEVRWQGMAAYDSYFRQQAVGDDKADWSRINQSLYAIASLLRSVFGERPCGAPCTPRHGDTRSQLRREGWGRGGGLFRVEPVVSRRASIAMCAFGVPATTDFLSALCMVKGDKDGKAPRVQVQTEGRRVTSSVSG